ncbi:MAG: protein translocase subunit SecD [Coriobacteriales bacterium]|nr:protein translocase subunit SecD [Coriobacteriales bacterium]
MAKKNESPERKTGVAAWKEETGGATHAQNRAGAERRNRVIALVALAALCIACVVCFIPVKERITRGLWLKEGTAVTFAVTKEDGSKPSAEEMNNAVGVVRHRLASTGISEYDVSTSGEDSLVVTLPWNMDAQTIARSVGGAGKIEFARFDSIGDADALVKINAGTSGVELRDGSYTAFMDGSMIESAEVADLGSGSYAVTLTFNDEGKQVFADVTKELAEDSGQIALIVDGAVLTAPSVSQEISDGVVSISGFTKEEAESLKALVESDTLSLKMTASGTASTDPLIGKQMLWGLVFVAIALLVGVTVASFVKFGRLAVVMGGAMLVFGITLLGMLAIGSMSNMFVLTMPGVVGGACAGWLCVISVWLMIADFYGKVSQGRNIRGAAMSAPHDGMRRMLVPVLALSVLSAIAMFLPIPVIREIGTTFVLGAVSGVIAVFWYAVTLLRLLASTSIQAHPESWGVKAVAVDNVATAEAS